MKPARKNRTAGGGNKGRPNARFKTYPLEEGRQRFEGFEQAYPVFKEFHDREPRNVKVAALDDGKDEVTVLPMHVALHRTLETNYVVPWDSNKQGVLWLHEHKEGHGLRGLEAGKPLPKPHELPLEIYDPQTRTTRKLGGKFKIKDWWYD